MIPYLFLFLSILLPSLLLYILVIYLQLPLPHHKFYQNEEPSSNIGYQFQNILLVIAHPDDEVMFFGPTILDLKKNKNIQLSVLCFSNGDYDGLGKIREKELINSCKKLGIKEADVHILNDSRFKDGPSSLWPPNEVAKTLETYITKLKIRTLLSFDLQGISGHINHIALRVGIEYLLRNHPTASHSNKAIVAYQLISVPLLRKYIGVFDLLFTLSKIQYNDSPLKLNIPDSPYVPDQILTVATMSEILKIREAMFEHKSQLVWFRRLYLLFSRYMIMNTLERVTV